MGLIQLPLSLLTYHPGQWDGVWQFEPPHQVTQTDSQFMPSRPFSEVVTADLVKFEGGSQGWWSGNHVPGGVAYDGTESPGQSNAGSNNLRLDGHVEWVDCNALRLFLDGTVGGGVDKYYF